MMSNGALRMPGDGRDGARLRAQAGGLRAEGVEVLQHRHAALEERQVVAAGVRAAGGDDVGRDARQPDVEQEAGRVVDQLVVLVGPHPGLLLSGSRYWKPVSAGTSMPGTA